METEEEASGQMTDEIYTNDVDDESLSQQQQRRLIISGEQLDIDAYAYTNGVDDESIINGEQLDIDAYAAVYIGRTKISRLIFIADKCGNVSMQLEALRMAYDEIEKGENTQLFREVVHKIDGRLGPNYSLDSG
ncbi:unnamed protein product [Lactuca saligna]|uniref:Uncharacterized protein n=1 Tax=Lactuca saligna TaxID=75948 RepID=A0AA36EDB7_LACSI|nr:unnamed protein product [Lactuca saligna]